LLVSASRSSPTFHAVVRGDSFLGAGMRLALTPRHTEAAEHANNTSTTGCRTNATAGNSSKFFSVSDSVIKVLSVFVDVTKNFNNNFFGKTSIK
jgi:hypothetical protein